MAQVRAGDVPGATSYHVNSLFWATGATIYHVNSLFWATIEFES
jgi:hypothetical protein